MQLIQEIVGGQSKILIVCAVNSLLKSELSRRLLEHHVRIFSATHIPVDIAPYDVVFIINPSFLLLNEYEDLTHIKFILLFTDDEKSAHLYTDYAYQKKLKHIKIVSLQRESPNLKKDIDTCLWFVFSNQDDIYLHIYHHSMHKKNLQPTPRQAQHLTQKHTSHPLRKLFLVVILILLFHVSSIGPLLFASLMYKSAATAFVQKQEYQSALKNADISLKIGRAIYRYAEPVLRLFSLAKPFEDIIEINTSASKVLHSAGIIEENARVFLQYGLTRSKSANELEQMKKAKHTLFATMFSLQNDVRLLSEKIAPFAQFDAMKTKMAEISDLIPMITQMETHLDELLGLGKEKKYLLLFANNMELRPGGGFIGSYAIATVHDYTITRLQVFDVYDADGQLTEHIEPPDPIKNLLNQPHWYLRDSAFNPDFAVNARQAEFFLSKEMNESQFDGVILITTSAVQALIGALDQLYIPDYHETVTKDNFYIKAQLYAEKDFFPGSLQKKRFLGSVLDQLMLNIDHMSPSALTMALFQSLNEKQIVINVKNNSLQDFAEKNYWAGRMLKPTCRTTEQTNCILDYVFPVDANLGVNKANFFIKRPVKLSVLIDEDGHISDKLSFEYTNSSYPDIFPGGTYKNYFQLFVSPNSNVTKVLFDNEPVANIVDTNFEYKAIEFPIEIPPQAKKTVEISYELPQTIVKGHGAYQLIFQKQTGSQNENLLFEIQIPTNMRIVGRDLSPLVKGDKIIYNTSISSDKIFMIEFSKE